MNQENQVLYLNIDDILPNRFQPRIKFNDQAINELAESIKLHGVIQPIVVRRISDKYEIIAGERRYKASIIAGKKTIPAIVTSLDDKNSAEVALIENVQRQDLTPIEEAISYKKILDMGYINQGELGEKLGKKQSTVANKLRLLNLNDEVQEALMENKISERHARSLLKLDDKKQILMLNRIINERLTVRKTDEEIEKLLSESGDDQKIKEEKGEPLMNNDVLKEFNIPTDPIIEDATNDSIIFDEEEKQPLETNFQQQPVENSISNETINPSFMDIDRIQSQAQDIIKEPEPVANLDELLKPDETVTPTMEQLQMQSEETQQEPNPMPQGGKFFNMFNFNDHDKDENFVENVETEQVNMDFGEPKYDSSSIFTNPMESFNQVTNEQSHTENNPQQPVENLDDTIKLDSIPLDEPIDLTNTDNSSDYSIDPIPVEENDDNLINFSKPVNSFTLTDEETFANKDNNLVQDIQEPIKKSYMMDDDVTFDSEGEIEVKVNKPNERFVTADMKTVINTIRECAATIERFGYKIDTDEIDLADTYEVTFKISKNNEE
jgi:ParB family chromosome partitioning protein